MCKLMDDLVNDTVKDAVKDRNLDIAKKLISLGNNSLSEIAKALDLPLSTVEELASSMRKTVGV